MSLGPTTPKPFNVSFVKQNYQISEQELRNLQDSKLWTSINEGRVLLDQIEVEKEARKNLIIKTVVVIAIAFFGRKYYLDNYAAEQTHKLDL